MPIRAGDPELPEGVRTLVTEVTVTSVLDPDYLDPDYEVTVQWRGGETYAVTRRKQCYDADGDCDWEPQPSNRDSDWLARHRFSYDQAIALAARVCAERATRITENKPSGGES